MDNKEKTLIEELADKEARVDTILVLKKKTKLEATDEGMELNDGYEFEVNAALPEIADGIAKLAAELEPNGFGEGSGKMFITLINNYYDILQENKE